MYCTSVYDVSLKALPLDLYLASSLSVFFNISCQVFADNFMRREVQSFVVHCTFTDDGCPWKGEVRHLEVNG